MTYKALKDLNPGLSVSICDHCFQSSSPRPAPSSPPSLLTSLGLLTFLEREAMSLYLAAAVPRSCRKAPFDLLVSSLSSCVHFACEATDCPELAVENASLNCSSSDRYHGAQCTVSCRTGHMLQIRRDDELIKSQVCAGAGPAAPRTWKGCPGAKYAPCWVSSI